MCSRRAQTDDRTSDGEIHLTNRTTRHLIINQLTDQLRNSITALATSCDNVCDCFSITAANENGDRNDAWPVKNHNSGSAHGEHNSQ